MIKITRENISCGIAINTLDIDGLEFIEEIYETQNGMKDRTMSIEDQLETMGYSEEFKQLANEVVTNGDNTEALNQLQYILEEENV